MPVAIVRNPDDAISTFKVVLVEKSSNVMVETKTHNYSIQDVVQELNDNLVDTHFVYSITNLETDSVYSRADIAKIL